MAQNPPGKQDKQDKFTPTGEISYLGLEQARLFAIDYARANPNDYLRRVPPQHRLLIAQDVQDVEEYYRIVVSFRADTWPEASAGTEELHVRKAGTVDESGRVSTTVPYRNILRPPRLKRFPTAAVAAIIAMLLIGGGSAAAYFSGLFNGESPPVRPGPTPPVRGELVEPPTPTPLAAVVPPPTPSPAATVAPTPAAQPTPQVAGRVGYHAPDFTLPTVDGASFTLSQHQGKVVVVNFWASWVIPSREEMPHLQQAYEQKAPEGIVFLAVSVQETQETAMAFAKELKLNLPLSLDTDGAVTTEYLVTALPTTVLIDEQGVIRRKMVGYFKSVQEILDFMSASVTPTPAPTAVPTSTLTLTRTPTPIPTLTPFPTRTPAPVLTPTRIPVPTPSQGPLTGKIAFVSSRYGAGQIFTINPDGTGLIRLTTSGTTWGAQNDQLDWSPDGSRLAIGSSGAIYTMNSDGSDLRRITSGPEDYWPAWSPDGEKLAFSSRREGNLEIYLMDVDGSNLINLTHNAAHDTEPSWSPDGSRIVFRSTRDGNDEIYIMNANGTGQTRLTKQEKDDFHPAWSPDYRKIAFVSERNGKREIFLMNPDGTAQTKLTDSYDDIQPRWSPDGSNIVIASAREGNYDIYTISVDSTAAVNLTHDGGTDWMPAWCCRR